MASISTITLPNGSEYDLKDATARAQLMSTIAGFSVSSTTGAMELWSQDLNDITKTGFYNAMTCTNAKYPYSTLIVIGYYLSGYCTQIQVDVTTGTIATRSQINGTWSNWVEIDTSKFYTKTESDALLLTKADVSSVTLNLPNSTSSSQVTKVITGGEYKTTISANFGYKITSVTVTMDGVDITDDVFSGTS